MKKIKNYSISNEGHLEEFDGIDGKLSFIEGLNEDWSLGKGYLFTTLLHKDLKIRFTPKRPRFKKPVN